MPVVDLHLLIRYTHIAAMALILGGALLLWGMSTMARDGRQGLLLLSARRYELWFWLALGVLVMTGVGNLGAMGTALPAPATSWGGKFTLKLSLVVLFMLLSIVRTFLVVRLHAAQDNQPPALPLIVRSLYAGTALLTLAILFVAVALAHAGA